MPTVTLNQTYYFFEEVLYYFQEVYDKPIENWRIDEDRLKKENNKKKPQMNAPDYVMSYGYFSTNVYNAIHLDKISVNYIPDVGTYEFQFKDHAFKITIEDKTSNHDYKKNTQLTIDCDDMDTITNFIMEGIHFQFGKALDKNVVKWYTLPKPMSGLGDMDWESKTIPETTLADIYLPREKKENIVKDIKEFLLPETLEWYQRKKIPHHRIYLYTKPNNDDDDDSISDPDTPPRVNMYRGHGGANVVYQQYDMNTTNTINQLIEALANEFKLNVYIGVANGINIKPAEKSIWVIPSNSLTADTVNQIEKYEGIIIITAGSMSDIEESQMFDKSYIDCVVEFSSMDEENIMDLIRFFYDELQNEESNELLANFAKELVVCEVSEPELKRYLHRFRHYNGPETLDNIKDAFMKMKEIKDQQHDALTATMSSSKISNVGMQASFAVDPWNRSNTYGEWPQ